MDSFTSSADGEKGVFTSGISIGAPSKLRSLQRRIARILIPSFLSASDRSAREKIRATDFLDGMRGYAALLVYFCHFIMPTHPKAHFGYGGNNGVDDYWITQLPILRLLYSGHVSVSLFFVISGFSVSLKPLEQTRKGMHSSLFDTMVSATFRRPCRLYTPSLVVLLITFVLACCGAFDFSYALTKQWPFPSKPLRIPMVHETMLLQAKDFASQVWYWADPLSKKNQHVPYGVQLWTIPVELRLSFMSFIAIIGLAKVRSPVRIGIITAIAAYFQLQRHPEATLFLGGTVLAEVHLIHEERDAASSSPSTESQFQRIRAGLLFLFGLFLVSYPPRGGTHAIFCSPFSWLGSLIVGESEAALEHLYVTIGSLLLVYIVDRSPFLQSIFTTAFARYLGKTSFALYCVHQALINWFGYRSILFFWSYTGRETLFQYEFGNGIAWVFQTLITFWVADIFWRYVDAPCIRFTKWVEAACTSASGV